MNRKVSIIASLVTLIGIIALIVVMVGKSSMQKKKLNWQMRNLYKQDRYAYRLPAV